MFWDECSPGQWKICTLILPELKFWSHRFLCTRGKLRQRGFNQSELIARSALKLKSAGWPLPPERKFAGTLPRNHVADRTVRHQQRENIRGAFRVTKPDELNGREVLVVDDVFTTGTTVSECARILRRAGASKVYVATVARTLKTEVQPAIRESETETRVAMAAAG